MVIDSQARRSASCWARVAAVVATLLVAATCGSDPSTPETTEPLPLRPGPRTVTSYTVPHVQHFVDPVPEVDAELRRRIFELPDVERRESITSITGTDGVWLSPAAPEPAAALRDREFAHIHPDGSLHLVMPVDRAVEAIEAKWAEFHPWVGSENMWDGTVMLYTPQSAEEMAVTLQLVVDSYNFVTDRAISPADLG